MGYWNRIVSVIGGRRILVGLGGIYVFIAVGQASRHLAGGSPVLEAISNLLLVGIPGFLVLYGGYRLPDTDIRPETYARIVAWALGGFGLLLGVVGLRVLSPGVTIDAPLWSIVLATAIGTVAGFAIGVNEARAFSRAHVAEQRSQELEETTAELEETVEQLEETKTELKNTVEHLQTSNERLEQFAYAASHDLQEPLRMVSSYLQLLENRYADDLDEDALEFIDFAVDGADRMRRMVDSLLEYSRVSRSESLEPTDANAVFDDVLDDIQLRIEEADATITTDDLPTVTADPDQLAQVFRNLISNALTYSGDEPPQVHVSAERTNGAWRFAVADEGIGIDPDYHSRIFNVFERVHTDEETSESGAGGIGLALCERIIERHAGEIWVESESGEGATFHFTVPLVEEQRTTPDTRFLTHSGQSSGRDE